MRLIVVSNRGPVRQTAQGEFAPSSGGLATALDPLLAKQGGTWIWQEDEAAAARAAAQGALPDYGSAFVTVPEAAQAGFYEGFSNGILWPLLHSFHPTDSVGSAPWDDYVVANQAFAETTCSQIRDGDAVWIQDYHLMLVPKLVRRAHPKARIGWFCHVPWPGADLFQILPWRRELLSGLSAADVLGFHSETYADNFLRCVDRLTDAEVDYDRRHIVQRGHLTEVVAAPIGIDVDAFRSLARRASCRDKAAKLVEAVGGRRVILGVDRLDYTKGIVERMRAYERWLERHQGMENEFAFVQVMVPSRTKVPAYASLKEEVDQVVGRINGRFATTGHVPVHYLYRSLDREELVAHYRSADVALVTPLRDGMNLVAHEYVASRGDSGGVLVLSELAGAAEHLDGALIVNPYDLEGLAEAIDKAVTMPPSDRRWRMRRLNERVRQLDVHSWAASFLGTLRGPIQLPAASGRRVIGSSGQQYAEVG